MTRFVRTLVPLVMLGLAGLPLGCSGGQSAAPLAQADKEATKKDMAERKEERKEAAQERALSKKQEMKGMRRGRGGR